MEIINVFIYRVCCNIRFSSEIHPKSRQKHLSRIAIYVIKSFWKFAQSTAAILSCSMQNCKTISPRNSQLREHLMSRNFSGNTLSGHSSNRTADGMPYRVWSTEVMEVTSSIRIYNLRLTISPHSDVETDKISNTLSNIYCRYWVVSCLVPGHYLN